MLRADYTFITNETSKNKQGLKDPRTVNMDYFENRFYRFQLDFLNRAQTRPSTLDNSSIEMQKKYKFGTNIFKYDWFNPPLRANIHAW